jgi:hypothetical protein
MSDYTGDLNPGVGWRAADLFCDVLVFCCWPGHLTGEDLCEICAPKGS